MPVGTIRFFWAVLLVLLPTWGLASTTMTDGMPEAAPLGSVAFCARLAPPNTLAEAQSCDYSAPTEVNWRWLAQPVKWVRITVNGSQLSTHALAIQVAPHFISKLTLYTLTPAATDNTWQVIQSGAAQPAPNPASVLGGYLFVVQPAAQGTTTYYLRIESPVSKHVAISLQPWPSPELQPQIWVGGYLGILLLVLLFATASAMLDPNLLMRRFAVYIAAVFFSALSGSGLVGIYWLPNAPALAEALFTLSVCLRMASWAWLTEGFLHTYATARWYKPLFRATILFSLCVSMLSWTDWAGVTVVLLAPCLIMLSLVQLWVVARTPGIDRVSRRILLVGYGLTPLLSLLVIASTMLPLPQNLPIHLVRLLDFVPPMLLLLMVIFKSRQERHELTSVRSELTEAQLRSEFEHQLLEERGMLVDMLTHELKNPLASISLAVGSLSKHFVASDAQEQRRLHNIHQSIINMDTVIERVSLMNELGQDSLPLLEDTVALQPLLAALVQTLQTPERFSIAASAPVSLRTDPKLLRMILRNLLENAEKYSPANSEITITLNAANTRSSACVSIAVCNAVTAAQAPDVAGLFTRFYRHPASQAVSGSGLGLYLVREICQRLGGSVMYRAENGAAIFTVELPQ